MVLLVALGLLDRRLQQTGGPGIVPFELAGSLTRAEEILADWGSAGRDTARLSLWLDFAFLVAYGAFLALATAALRDLADRRGWRRLAPPSELVVLLPVGAAGLDALENVFLLLTVGEHGGAVTPRLAAIFAAGKFALLGVTLAYILAVLTRVAASARQASACQVIGSPSMLTRVIAVGASRVTLLPGAPTSTDRSRSRASSILTPGAVGSRLARRRGQQPLLGGAGQLAQRFLQPLGQLLRRRLLRGGELLGRDGPPRGGSSSFRWTCSHSPRSQRDRTRREDRRLNFYELRDNSPTTRHAHRHTRASHARRCRPGFCADRAPNRERDCPSAAVVVLR